MEPDLSQMCLRQALMKDGIGIGRPDKKSKKLPGLGNPKITHTGQPKEYSFLGGCHQIHSGLH